MDIVFANKIGSGDVDFRVGQAMLTLATRDAGAAVVLVRHTQRWSIKPDTTAIVVLVRDRATGRVGTLEMPVNRIPVGSPAGARD